MKKKYICAIDGQLARNAVCGYSKINGGCGAHGNYKCEHKSEEAKREGNKTK